MTWHLKNRALERKLDKLSDGVFSDNLHKREDGNFVSVFGASIAFGKISENDLRFSATFSPDEVREFVYNPNDWNRSYEVKPPENVIFRAKIYMFDTAMVPHADYDCLIFSNNNWHKVRDGKPTDECICLCVGDFVEYRPWED